MRTLPVKLGIVLLMTMCIGCSKNQPLVVEAKTVAFGSSYRLLSAEAEPALKANVLQCKVGYSGCSPNHPFKLDFRAKDKETAEIWLIHDYRQEYCEAYHRQDITLALPEALLAYPNIILLSPDGESITIR